MGGVSLMKPKILVSSAPGNLKLDEDNSTYVVETIGIEIRVDCWAPYPINIDFKGHLVRASRNLHLRKINIYWSHLALNSRIEIQRWA